METTRSHVKCVSLATIITWLAMILVVVGCSNDPGDSAQPQEMVLSWVGVVFSSGKQGAGCVGIHVEGPETDVEGDLILDLEDGVVRDLKIRGTVVSDRVLLELNTDEFSYGFSLSIDAAMDAFGRLTGVIQSEGLAVDAEIDCRPIDRLTLTPVRSRELDRDALALTFNGTDFWSTSSGNYFRMNQEGDVLEELTVFLRENTRWTSTALAMDDSLFWGHLPLTVAGEGEAQDLSDVISFDREGTVLSENQMDHRTSGLAASAGELWSLCSEEKMLHRISAGATTSTLDFGVPGLIYLAFDGGQFWSLSWFDSRIYQIDGSGEVLRVYDMVTEDDGFPAGIACGEGRVWVLMSEPLASRSALYELEAPAP